MNIREQASRFLLRNKEIRNASWIIGGKFIQMALSFVVSIFTTRFLGPSNFGTLNYGLAYVNFFSVLGGLGLGPILLKTFVDKPEKQGKILGTAMVMQAIACALSTLLIIGIVYVIDRKEPLTVIVVSIVSLSLIFHPANTSFTFWFQARYQSKVSSIATIIAFLIVSIYRIVLLGLQKSVTWFAFAQSLEYICIAIVLYVAYIKAKGPKLSISITEGRHLLNESYHLILSNMMIAIYAQTDKLMLKRMMDEASVGYYSLASSINTMWVFILSAIIDSIYPTIVSLFRTNKNDYIRKNKQMYCIVFYISVFVALIFTFFGELFIKIVYGTEYLPSAAPLRIVTWYVIFSYLSVARNAWIVCEGQQKYLKYMYLSAAVINIMLNLIMIPNWGPSGAAAASLITQIFSTIIIPLFIPKMRENVIMMFEAIAFKGILKKKK
jgi:O-antigen/teichoic acid export membrane protein